MEMFLTLVSGIGWMVVYEECIRIGLRDKTYCMPLWALALNFAWESMYTAMEVSAGDFQVQTWVNLIWCGMDVGILLTYLRFGRDEFEQRYPMAGVHGFAAWTALAFATSYILQIACAVQFPEGLDSECWSAFLQNLLMSVLFVTQLERRQSSRGSSIALAVAKWLGTLAPTITLGILQPRPLVLAAGLLCTVFDLIYIALLARTQRAETRE